ncbi:OLC1v1004617C2 [Oldenlandia corymbosa var. corymbosa]|uniref:Biogenesis of lysosome-related organelles complex 1 subunit 1 n=1 Tax=Oldenlandia corymbosa var. corymbosa TaxID=529605 RepID=A0AAV1DCQ8_OLDCO|nr:OLC1v1004617C2 [Oldenlandia corymbosa var. corymbosa]
MDRSKATEFGGLEASLLQMINAHNQSAVQLREHTEKAKKDAITSAKRVATLLVDCVNGGVQEAFIMEKRIEMEIRLLAAAILRFGKNTDQWLAASHSINTAIKEIGDFENWMKTMEFDCKSINAAIRNIHES